MSRAYDPDAPVRCGMCRDTGVVIVPHPRCVSVRLGRLVTWPGSRAIRTGAVACSNRVPDPSGFPATCPPGQAAAAAGMKTWDRYTGEISGLDGVSMLDDLEADLAAAARGGRPRGESLREFFPRWAEIEAGLRGSVTTDGHTVGG